MCGCCEGTLVHMYHRKPSTSYSHAFHSPPLFNSTFCLSHSLTHTLTCSPEISSVLWSSSVIDWDIAHRSSRILWSALHDNSHMQMHNGNWYAIIPHSLTIELLQSYWWIHILPPVALLRGEVSEVFSFPRGSKMDTNARHNRGRMLKAKCG